MKIIYFRNGEWLPMTQQTQTKNHLTDILTSQQEEINRHKWIESEKAGYDIGWECASRDWTRKHFPEWKHRVWSPAVQNGTCSEKSR